MNPSFWAFARIVFPMLEITGDDVALLNDTDLRALVGLLCQAELRKHSLSTSHMRYGGHQNAADEGVDVYVELPSGSNISGFIPRPETVFQTKREDMPRSSILDEMRPKGTLRPIIQELANHSGAYVIVSSQGSTAYPALRDRRDAMREAVRGIPNADALTLEFYDRSHIATWVREHGGVVLWVRSKIGKPLRGWRGYEQWAPGPRSASDTYLADEKLRLHTATKEDANGLTAEDEIRRIRDLLRESRTDVRLVGLSGVGKTRFAEALFDGDDGDGHLDPALAYYTNVADDPNPQPHGLASQLIAEDRRAILVVDNCPQELHRRLSELCRSANSKLSILTIELDISEDQPEGTSVFKLRSASDGLIEKLIRRRVPAVSELDLGTITRFSDGNAAVAIALASTIGMFETIGTVTDAVLLRRYVHQRHEHDESLFQVAQACSLAYSFQGEDASEADEAELFRLGALIGKNAMEMYSGVAELMQRELVQQRNVWRAALPHGIANRLATGALQKIPLSAIEARFRDQASGRLIRSFSRRVGYLGEEGRSVAEKWLAAGGLLGDVGLLSELEQAMFENVAPAAPEAAVSAVGRTLLKADEDTVRKCEYCCDVIRSIAYDPKLFERCVILLARIVQPTSGVNGLDRSSETLTSLFHIYLSGTHATIEQRVLAIRRLHGSNCRRSRDVGMACLEALLNAGYFSSFHNFDFGARSRDYGYQPRTEAEVKHWYSCALELGEELACSDEPSASRARSAIATRFRELWTGARMYDDLERVCRAIAARHFWPDGWRSVRFTRQYDTNGSASESNARLTSLEEVLRPRDVSQQVRSIVLSSPSLHVDFEDFEGDDDPIARINRTLTKARNLGEAVAADEQMVEDLSAELLTGRGNLFAFGGGLARGAEDATRMWTRMVAQVAAIPEDQLNLDLLCGFLSELYVRDSELTDAILDEACVCPTLGRRYPLLQRAVSVDKRGFERVMRSLALGKAPISTYRFLSYGPGLDALAPADLRVLLSEIASKPDGIETATEVLSMRLHVEKDAQTERAHDILQAGSDLMKQVEFSRRHDISEDHRLGSIVKACLSGEDGAGIAGELCRKLILSVSSFSTYSIGHDFVLEALFNTQPAATLDGLFAGGAKETTLGLRVVTDVRGDALSAVPENVLFGWCDKEPERRYPLIAAAIAPIRSDNEKTPPRWTELALLLLQRAPDRVLVLKQFIGQFRPRSGWGGSLATILEANAKLLDEFDGYQDASLVEFVQGEKVRLAQWIEDERRRETAEDRQRNERFE
jgi:hypothetical protein